MDRKKTIEEQVQEFASNIQKEISEWERINKDGCNDPSWPDGGNMNLVRNHIIYYKTKITELCENNGLKFPEEMFLPTPPEVDPQYMADLKPTDRVKRLKRFGDKLTRKGEKYDSTQLSLF